MLKFRFSRTYLVQASALAVLLFPAVAAANTITVNSASDWVSDDSTCTLREAILSANTNAPSGETPGECAAGAPGHDTIQFDIPGAGVHTIRPASAFPVITEPLTIDGYSQPGASPNTYSFGNNAVLSIEIDGTNAGNLSSGLLEISAGNSTVRGLVVNRVQGNSSAALRLTAGGNTVAGNWIGIGPDGTTRLANKCRGIAIESSSGNTIGGLSPADRNVITGLYDCGASILISGSADNQVINNYIGTNAEGFQWWFNAGDETGILIGDSPGGIGSTGNVIGGTMAGARNVISMNGIAVVLTGPGTSGNTVQGNYIGLSSSGFGEGNSKGGIKIDSGAHDNTIGGTTTGAGNTIVYSNGIGVSLDLVPSPAGSGNAILGNFINHNNNLGIDLKADGVTANDACDADAGPNGLQNFPVIALVTAGAGSTTIQGTLDAAADKQYQLEFFAVDYSNMLITGLGQIFLGSTAVTTDSSCHSDFEVTFPLSVAAVAQVTATATDDHNNTSEFAPFVGVRTQYYTLAPCRVADTRDPPGPSGGPALLAGQARTFPVAGICEIPATARAVAIVLAVWDPPAAGDLRLYPAAGRAPLASTINFRAGVVRANPAIIPLSLSGEISVQCECLGNTNFFFDVYGYFQ